MLPVFHFYIFLQSISLALICFFAKARSDRRYLGFFFLCFSAQAVYILLAHDPVWLTNYFYCTAFSKAMSLLAPTFLFLHVKRLTATQIDRYDNLLYVPALIFLGVFVFLYQSGHFTSLKSYLSSSFFFIVQISSVIYSVVLVLHWLLLLRDKVRASPLYLEQRLIIVWIQWLFFYFIFRAVIAGLFIPIQLHFGVHAIEEWYLWVVTVSLLLMLFTVSYLLLRNPYLFDSLYNSTDYNLEQKLIYSVLPAVDKTQVKARLSNDLMDTYQKRIREVMEIHEVYTDTLLTQRQLSEMLGIPVHHLSLIINQSFGRSFNQFVNEYRVEKAKKILSDPAKQSEKIFAIGIDSGFNSESSFYTVFKKMIGVTPSEYRAGEFSKIV